MSIHVRSSIYNEPIHGTLVLIASSQSLCCSHTQSLEIGEGSDITLTNSTTGRQHMHVLQITYLPIYNKYQNCNNWIKYFGLVCVLS